MINGGITSPAALAHTRTVIWLLSLVPCWYTSLAPLGASTFSLFACNGNPNSSALKILVGSVIISNPPSTSVVPKYVSKPLNQLSAFSEVSTALSFPINSGFRQETLGYLLRNPSHHFWPGLPSLKGVSLPSKLFIKTRWTRSHKLWKSGSWSWSFLKNQEPKFQDQESSQNSRKYLF